MKNHDSLISIIIPVYNRANIIHETLDSIKKQTYSYWECIIVDDGSTDNLNEIIDNYIKSDFRFKFDKRPKERLKGGNASRNYGFEISKGEFINWFDSDDIMLPDFLENKISVLNNNKELDFCACYSKLFSGSVDNIKKTEKPFVLNSNNYLEDYLLNGLYFDTASPLWRRSFLNENNLLFDESLLRSQERDFHLRVLSKKPKYNYLDEALFLSREGVGNSITKNFTKNFKLQLSNFKFYDKAFSVVKKRGINTKKILSYIFYRQSVNYYSLFQVNKENTLKKVVFAIKYFKYLIKYCFYSNLNIMYFFKLFLGFFSLLFFKRGYKYFYFPEFNFRSYDEQ
ncbi:glycosyltransferase family 2 protein [Polaribacter sp. Asnod1-A03]|uniref:glycosyltransferase family 2 protein n=1 Tax=Polaribacter sp. Asnod1-A03 TaxID=3160581 RepID=UPI00386B1E7D